MKVQIENDLYIKSDTYGFMVVRYKGTRTEEKTGKEIEQWETLGNYTTIAGCVKKLLSMKVKESTAETLGELVEDVRRIEEYIESKITA